MSTVALDTNIVSKLLGGDHGAIAGQLDRIETFYIPWAVHAELLAGIKAGSAPAKYTPILEQFLAQPYVLTSRTVASDTIVFYAEIYETLRRAGTPVSPNDLWIAAECAQQGLPLYTLDADFQYIPQIVRFV